MLEAKVNACLDRIKTSNADGADDGRMRGDPERCMGKDNTPAAATRRVVHSLSFAQHHNQQLK